MVLRNNELVDIMSLLTTEAIKRYNIDGYVDLLAKDIILSNKGIQPTKINRYTNLLLYKTKVYEVEYSINKALTQDYIFDNIIKFRGSRDIYVEYPEENILYRCVSDDITCSNIEKTLRFFSRKQCILKNSTYKTDTITLYANGVIINRELGTLTSVRMEPDNFLKTRLCELHGHGYKISQYHYLVDSPDYVYVFVKIECDMGRDEEGEQRGVSNKHPKHITYHILLGAYSKEDVMIYPLSSNYTFNKSSNRIELEVDIGGSTKHTTYLDISTIPFEITQDNFRIRIRGSLGGTPDFRVKTLRIVETYNMNICEYLENTPSNIIIEGDKQWV